ncbi:hypothetical protein DICPUDRAFT_78061 [Dictyostelium purpureum]|uniref:Uncharacterized protein n=1 Tax=Dictyostelium purpureum TaxID=5786 RepID=F0ZIF6_DICPU|nr:uncharacterized protein DICPUDRAFT_78061 [Dictyostelium purpureum]EGC36274.1 hypothetical protein DICPUDRAFT_78061 [Dictyostelium purpureum]|eukprot:XP_003287220.1 hypothetical protein DICPUDRAFT_78061 [Dictyostelium purpureum]
MENPLETSSSSTHQLTEEQKPQSLPVNQLTATEKWRLIFNFNQISEQTKFYLVRVYLSLIFNITIACFGVLFTMFIWRPNIYIQIGLLIYTCHYFLDTIDAHGLKIIPVMKVSFVLGITTSDLILFHFNTNPSVVLSAFICTCGIFAIFTIFAFHSYKRTIIYWGSLISTVSVFGVGLLIAKLVFGFSSSIFLSVFYTILVGLYVLFIIYDTQLIIYKIEVLGDRNVLSHSVVLFLDFLDLFKLMLSVFSQKESNDKKRKD